MQHNSGLVWFRSDLRVQDNPALYHASQQCSQVIGVYLLFPGQWKIQYDSNNKLYFWMQNLKALENELSKLNIPLIVASAESFSNAPATLLELSGKHHCQSLWLNDEYGVYEQQRDDDTERLFRHQSIPCHRYHQQTLFIPGTLRNKQGDYFKVFTPFKKYLFQQITPEQTQPLPAPVQQAPLSIKHINPESLEQLYKPTASHIDDHWPAGEAAAQNSLDSFLAGTIEEYHNQRDYPSIAGTSSLSPWLAAGTLSIRQCFHQALQANHGEMDTGNKGITTWISELIWREFYKHILFGFPRVSMHRAFKPETEQLQWQTNPSALKAWQEGRTGFPIVDAAMRQLTTTGWMHNRLRMITAMFLSKNLLIDWRLGEQFFMEHLIDGDLAANNGGWQWSASTGTDAAPYFRMFNPTSQSEKFDASGEFIRQWVPELANLDSKRIHTPHGDNRQMSLDCPDYPLPIVDHKASRQRVMDAFQALKS
ncbi:deoxyribodipyrimidine photolyase [Endozoicomonas montiporae]|uniref:Deoxyribodipyrimidine photo-lyase n=2 Tax=Endozoicomonas montiporae TaxID=1027273 RepID=A0A081MYU9_9GAMM|nr:deoxyribodipyrimidine photo-lyase [Endozoicomonas montiporae]AMO54835.1 deoxyribodipyrimidine photolyase [Endozoicomonas montiporae CL-33]KEQ11372.1 deoxyribodipyrimidine photolyase [Endozoicomonas montiporae]